MISTTVSREDRTHTSPDGVVEQDGTIDLREAPLPLVKRHLATGEGGLSPSEAEQRLQNYGYNELIEREKSPALAFLSYFWGPIPWMIEVAAVLSGLVHRWPDLGIILTLLVVNGIVGFWEEFQANNAIAALKSRLALQARVKRGGEWRSIPARELVPGDIVRLRLGDVIPADARLLDGDPVQVDQSALTGESLPVTHEPGDAVYSGSVVKLGEIDALVYATGGNTFFGKTAQLVEETRTVSHFQRAVLQIGNYLIVLALFLVAIIIGAALFRGDPLTTTLQFALVLTVAAIPVAMPTVLAVTMAVGARLLAAREAIVTRLASIEELAGIDVLCSDKTGTLTQNKLALGEPVSTGPATAQHVITCAALASRAEDEDPIDEAVLAGVDDTHALDVYHVEDFKPFDPVGKRTEATVRTEDRTFKTSKGAPQVIMALADNAERVRPQVERAIQEFAVKGYRALGVAQTDEKGSWQFIGLLPLYDPPREDSEDTLEAAERLGIRVKMITGDQVAIAREISGQLGLGRNVVDASVFGDTRHHESGQLADLIEEADGFAQVFPEHKYHIVDVLQQRGHIVGMTGDGVNDAPALKKADAGVAVSGATDAARAASDFVLLTPGLSVIIDALRESRRIFERMSSYATYRIAETVRVLLFMTLSILVFNFYPVTAVMIVLLALLNDGAILSIAYDRVVDIPHPQKWRLRSVLGIATVLGIAGVIASFGLFYIGERVFHLDRTFIQSLIYLKLSVAGHLTIFITRTHGRFWSVLPSPILLGAVLVTQLIATLITVYGVFMTPIGWGWALVVWGYALAWFLVNDQLKLVAQRLFE